MHTREHLANASIVVTWPLHTQQARRCAPLQRGKAPQSRQGTPTTAGTTTLARHLLLCTVCDVFESCVRIIHDDQYQQSYCSNPPAASCCLAWGALHVRENTTVNACCVVPRRWPPTVSRVHSSLQAPSGSTYLFSHPAAEWLPEAAAVHSMQQVRDTAASKGVTSCSGHTVSSFFCARHTTRPTAQLRSHKWTQHAATHVSCGALMHTKPPDFHTPLLHPATPRAAVPCTSRRLRGHQPCCPAFLQPYLWARHLRTADGLTTSRPAMPPQQLSQLP